MYSNYMNHTTMKPNRMNDITLNLMLYLNCAASVSHSHISTIFLLPILNLNCNCNYLKEIFKLLKY